jgi:hypothetical protein
MNVQCQFSLKHCHLQIMQDVHNVVYCTCVHMKSSTHWGYMQIFIWLNGHLEANELCFQCTTISSHWKGKRKGDIDKPFGWTTRACDFPTYGSSYLGWSLNVCQDKKVGHIQIFIIILHQLLSMVIKSLDIGITWALHIVFPNHGCNQLSAWFLFFCKYLMHFSSFGFVFHSQVYYYFAYEYCKLSECMTVKYLEWFSKAIWICFESNYLKQPIMIYVYK